MGNQQIKELLSIQNDYVWLNENFDKLVKNYTDQWIAIKNSIVIASDPDFNGLLSKLTDSAHTVVEFVTREPLGMIL